MAWFRTGTITVTNGSTTVSGSGTTWIANAAVGEALYAPDGRLYEIANISSDTSLTLGSAYLGATASAQTYVIVPSQSYIRDLAAQAADLVNNYSTIANNAGVGKFGDGTLAAPGIRFSDDLDTGFFRSASNEVTFVAGGVAQFKYNSSGLQLSTVNLDGGTIDSTAIGATTPSTGAFTNLAYTGTLTGGTGVVAIGTNQIYKDSSGRVGINTTTPNTLTKLTVNGAVIVGGAVDSAAALSPGIISYESPNIRCYVGDATGYSWRFSSRASATTTDLMTIVDTGNVGIGTAAPSRKLEVVGNGITIGSVAGSLSSLGVEILAPQASIPAAQVRAYIAPGSFDLGNFGNGDLLIASRTSAPTSIRFITGTTPATNMILDSNGRVGIGTATPAEKLHVLTSSNYAATFNSTTTAATTTRISIGGFTTATGGTGGTVAIGSEHNHSGTALSSMVFYTYEASLLERMRIDSSGNLLVGTTSSVAGRVQVANLANVGTEQVFRATLGSNNNNTSSYYLVCRTDSTDRMYIYGNGNVVNTNNSYGSLSDLKLKENIVDATPKLEKLNQVRIVNYNLKSDPDQKLLGVVAQELEQVFPSLVEESPDLDETGSGLGTTTKSVKYSVFVPILIKAIQEQQALIQDLTTRLEALEA